MIRNALKSAAALAVAVCLFPTTCVLAQDGGSSTATGISRLMNPAVSLNTLLLGQVSDRNATREANTIGLQEMEMQFSAVVDPFWTADVIVAFHQEHTEETEDAEADAHGAHYAVDIEKAMVEYQNMPRGLGLRIGHDYLPFGKYAPLHTHQFPFVHAPVGVVAFTGDHSLSGTGAELAWTVPLPWWAELKAYGVASTAEVFDGESRDLVYGARLNNLWDTSDDSTLELGFSALTGPGALHEDGEGGTYGLYGADLTWKWLDGATTGGAALNVVAEVLLPDPEHGEGDPLGFAGHVQYRFARQWWLGAGFSLARDTEFEPGHDHAAEAAADAEHGLHELREWKANLTLAPSEFSAVRLEVFRAEAVDDDYEDLGAALQVNFTIGSHPAHAY